MAPKRIPPAPPPPQPSSPGWSPQCRSRECRTRSRPPGRTRHAARTAPGGMKPPHQEPTAQEPWQLAGSGPVRCQIWPPPPPRPHTLQPLQQSPSLHMASWVSVHFLQQFPPLFAHSCRDSSRRGTRQPPGNAGSPRARPRRADLGPHSPPASRSRTPLLPPRSRCRTPEGPGAAGTEVGGIKSYWGCPQARCCHKPPPPKRASHPQGNGKMPTLLAFCHQA